MRDSVNVILLLDGSGSMDYSVNAVRRGVREFLGSQSKIDDGSTVEVHSFDGSQRTLLERVEASSLNETKINTVAERFYAGGQTAMLDAIGDRTAECFEYLAGLGDDAPKNNIVILVTDGHENASQRFSIKAIGEMVTEMEKDFGWDYLFIGANQDAYRVGQSYGIKPGKALSFVQDNAGIEKAFQAIARTVTAYRASGAPRANQFFTAEEHEVQRAAGAKAAPMFDQDIF